MRKLALILVPALASLGLVVVAAPAQAGCCVVVALDALDPPQPGEATEVGFTTQINNNPPSSILGDDLGITLAPNAKADATKVPVKRFAARQVGPTGHYVAAVTFPQTGSYTWAVTTVSGVRYELGEIAVGEDSTVGATSTSDEPSTSLAYRGSMLWRVTLPLVALAATAYVAAEMTRQWRRGIPTSP